MQYTIVDDDVEVAPIYRHAMARFYHLQDLCKNHGLAIEYLPTQMESQCKQQSKSVVVPVHGSLEKSSKIQGTPEMHVTSAARLRLHTAYKNQQQHKD